MDKFWLKSIRQSHDLGVWYLIPRKSYIQNSEHKKEQRRFSQCRAIYSGSSLQFEIIHNCNLLFWWNTFSLLLVWIEGCSITYLPFVLLMTSSMWERISVTSSDGDIPYNQEFTNFSTPQNILWPRDFILWEQNQIFVINSNEKWK